MSYTAIKARWDADPDAPTFNHAEAHRLYLWCQRLIKQTGR